MRVSRMLTGVALAFAAVATQAADPDQAIRQTLKSIQPDLPIEAVSESPLTGIYQVHLKGGRLLYASGDGQFVMQGMLFKVENGEAVNLTQKAESKGIAKEIASIPTSDMVVFAPKNPKTHITVFTDTDCGYCQKLHSEVAELNRQGVEVRYVAFPRQGIGSHGYNTLVSVWCSKDRQAAMNLAKNREEVPAAKCDNPVAKEYQLGQSIGVNGTPAIVLADGELIPGYQPAPDLAKLALQAGGESTQVSRTN
ncbi:DsbC family protein [Pseudomonas sp. RIT-PI-AD]|uniref:DsbC family protein n=1 Tax=Pseudomonas sp. RIT-PI-AD TaxID=3035294 RepID=UPI0021DB1B2A|nr:DsbC family protein [Pseudomonas sp. RIT-PI-AD]